MSSKKGAIHPAGCVECPTCRHYRLRQNGCSFPAPAWETGPRERHCLDYQMARGEDWHAMLYGNSDSRRFHQ